MRADPSRCRIKDPGRRNSGSRPRSAHVHRGKLLARPGNAKRPRGVYCRIRRTCLRSARAEVQREGAACRRIVVNDDHDRLTSGDIGCRQAGSTSEIVAELRTANCRGSIIAAYFVGLVHYRCARSNIIGNVIDNDVDKSGVGISVHEQVQRTGSRNIENDETESVGVSIETGSAAHRVCEVCGRPGRILIKSERTRKSLVADRSVGVALRTQPAGHLNEKNGQQNSNTEFHSRHIRNGW
jgi:hypothetical protein